MSRRVVAVIPMRDGSKGFPGKNVALLAGRPLVEHAVDQAISAGVDEVVITTNIAEVVARPPQRDVVVVTREPGLCGDDTPMDAVLLDLLAPWGDTTVVLLQVTSPLRRPEQIAAAISRYASADADLVMSVTRGDSAILKAGYVDDKGNFRAIDEEAYVFANRQALPPVFRPNGAIYVFGSHWYVRSGGFAGGRIKAFEMDDETSLDIDRPEDLQRAEALLR